MAQTELPDLQAVDRLAAELAPRLRPGDVILLEGPMGAGKTTFTRALVRALAGDPERVASPTFTLLHHYEARIPVVHVDAWRLADAAELLDIGFEELREGAVACVEWPSRVAGFLDPVECWRLTLDHHDGEGRVAELMAPHRT